MLDKIKKNYFILIITFLFIYFFFNLLGGDRGLISYIKKKEIYEDLKIKQNDLRIVNKNEPTRRTSMPHTLSHTHTPTRTKTPPRAQNDFYMYKYDKIPATLDIGSAGPRPAMELRAALVEHAFIVH